MFLGNQAKSCVGIILSSKVFRMVLNTFKWYTHNLSIYVRYILEPHVTGIDHFSFMSVFMCVWALATHLVGLVLFWVTRPKKRGTEQPTSTEADCSAPLKDSGTTDLQASRPSLTLRGTPISMGMRIELTPSKYYARIGSTL